MHNVKNAKGQSAFNVYLRDNAYAIGYSPSGEDVKLFKDLTDPPTEKQPFLLRWYNHMKSYTDEELQSWPSADTSAPKGDSEAKADEDDFDLFGSDEEDDEEKERITAARVKAYEEKKAKKPACVAKSNIIFDVKPWDDTVKIEEIEQSIRTIETDGLVWGASKVLPVAFGINKLQICCVVEDEKVSSDWLEEKIIDFEDLVQSVDIVAFNKV